MTLFTPIAPFVTAHEPHLMSLLAALIEPFPNQFAAINEIVELNRDFDDAQLTAPLRKYGSWNGIKLTPRLLHFFDLASLILWACGWFCQLAATQRSVSVILLFFFLIKPKIRNDI